MGIRVTLTGCGRMVIRIFGTIGVFFAEYDVLEFGQCDQINRAQIFVQQTIEIISEVRRITQSGN